MQGFDMTPYLTNNPNVDDVLNYEAEGVTFKGALQFVTILDQVRNLSDQDYHLLQEQVTKVQDKASGVYEGMKQENSKRRPSDKIMEKTTEAYNVLVSNTALVPALHELMTIIARHSHTENKVLIASYNIPTDFHCYVSALRGGEMDRFIDLIYALKSMINTEEESKALRTIIVAMEVNAAPKCYRDKGKSIGWLDTYDKIMKG